MSDAPFASGNFGRGNVVNLDAFRRQQREQRMDSTAQRVVAARSAGYGEGKISRELAAIIALEAWAIAGELEDLRGQALTEFDKETE